MHGKKKCVTEVGCDEYRTSLCESFSMCDHVAFKVWNEDKALGAVTATCGATKTARGGAGDV